MASKVSNILEVSDGKEGPDDLMRGSCQANRIEGAQQRCEQRVKSSSLSSEEDTKWPNHNLSKI